MYEKDIQIILKTYGLYSSEALIKKFLICEGITKDFPFSLGIPFFKEKEKKFYFLYKNKLLDRIFNFFHKMEPIYHALLSHYTFSSKDITPLWINKEGKSPIGLLYDENSPKIVVGLNIVEEIIRYRQGDPSKVWETKYKGGLGFDYERADYLFEDQLVKKYITYPWADYLGFFLTEQIAKISDFPLVIPLPKGAKGAFILTGDDDQAYLEKYKEQLDCIKGMPITYFLHPLTKHTEDTLKTMPANVDFGVHPDALDNPENYDELCKKQTYYIRKLTNRPIRSLRNHGFLNNGYLGHLKTWEECGIILDLNYGGVNGRCLTGSFIPMRVRRLDKTWSNHYSLLTTFGDGMIYALGMSYKEAILLIKKVVKQIEKHYPGVIVFNFHPQNIDDTKPILKEILKLSKRSGWITLKIEDYIDWLKALEGLTIEKEKNFLILQSEKKIKDMVLRIPYNNKWKIIKLKPWEKKIYINLKNAKNS